MACPVPPPDPRRTAIPAGIRAGRGVGEEHWLRREVPDARSNGDYGAQETIHLLLAEDNGLPLPELTC
jgi:hypothetical protein